MKLNNMMSNKSGYGVPTVIKIIGLSTSLNLNMTRKCGRLSPLIEAGVYGGGCNFYLVRPVAIFPIGILITTGDSQS